MRGGLVRFTADIAATPLSAAESGRPYLTATALLLGAGCPKEAEGAWCSVRAPS